MPHAAGHQQGTLVPVGLPVAAADGVLVGGHVGAVGGARALRPSGLHHAHLPRAAVHSLASLFTGFAGYNSKEAEKADLVHRQAGVGPCCVEATSSAALFSTDSTH